MGDVCRKKDNHSKGDLENEDRKVMKCDDMVCMGDSEIVRVTHESLEGISEKDRLVSDTRIVFEVQLETYPTNAKSLLAPEISAPTGWSGTFSSSSVGK